MKEKKESKTKCITLRKDQMEALRIISAANGESINAILNKILSEHIAKEIQNGNG